EPFGGFLPAGTTAAGSSQGNPSYPDVVAVRARADQRSRALVSYRPEWLSIGQRAAIVFDRRRAHGSDGVLIADRKSTHSACVFRNAGLQAVGRQSRMCLAALVTPLHAAPPGPRRRECPNRAAEFCGTARAADACERCDRRSDIASRWRKL